jgi:hypothetical protein
VAVAGSCGEGPRGGWEMGDLLGVGVGEVGRLGGLGLGFRV